MKIICGMYQMEEGEMLLNGEQLHLKSFKDAIKHEISIVNQEIQVIPTFSVAENILLDKLDKMKRGISLSPKKITETAKKYMDIVGLDLDPNINIGELSAAQKQLVQIAKALSSNAKVLLLDEPTSSLTQHETETFFKIVKNLRDKGIILIFVTHKLEEAKEICDKISVLRDGQYIGTRDIHEMNRQDIIEMMIGRKTKDAYLGELNINPQNRVLEVKGITRKGRFDDLSFHLNEGEILGFYGLVGSGRTELARIIIGEDRSDSGAIYIKGQKANIRSVSDCVNKYKIGYVSENRKEEGLILDDTVKTNLAITAWPMLRNKTLRNINLKKETELAESMVKAMNIKITALGQKVVTLSGGNQQKISLGKWLSIGCDVIIIDEPTIGVDVRAKETIHEIIWNLAKKEGKSIILISSDMPELCTLARRILVFKEFKIQGEINSINDGPHPYQELSPIIGSYLA